MIAKHEAQRELAENVWTRLAAPLPNGVTAWRQDGRPVARDGKYFARFVAYIDANTVRERLDSVVAGEWNLTLELLPSVSGSDDDGSAFDAGRCSFKARLQILGVVREDVGTGKDYKQASTDAFKRAAVRFGVAHELYALGQNWVQMDGDGRYAKPLEDPQSAYDRRFVANATSEGDASATEAGPATRSRRAPALTLDRAAATDVPPCPRCGGRMWDNRLGKRNPKAPDFKCRDRTCDGVIWPPRGTATGRDARVAGEPVDEPVPASADRQDAGSLELGSEEIPF